MDASTAATAPVLRSWIPNDPEPEAPVDPEPLVPPELPPPGALTPDPPPCTPIPPANGGLR